MRYRAYGLVLESELEFPELRAIGVAGAAEDDVPDVTIRFGTVSRRPEVLGDGGNGIWIEPGRSCHYRKGTGACLVEAGGTRIVVDRDGEPEPSLLRLAVLGPAMGLALMQRGLLLLHASAVGLGGCAVGFLGPHGAGKSTIAASLHALGHPLVTDDILALDRTDGDVHVLPTFPQLKLWDDAARNLGLQPEAMPRVHPEFDKWAWRLEGSVTEEPFPLARLYVLGVGDVDAVQIEAIEPVLASQYVMRNWYGARFGEELFRTLDQGAHFKRCIGVANAVAIRRLVRPRIESEFEEWARRIAAAIRTDLDLDLDLDLDVDV